MPKATAPIIADNYIEVKEIADPSTPPAGFVRIYAKSDNKMYRIGEDGVSVELGGGGGAAAITHSVWAAPWPASSAQTIQQSRASIFPLNLPGVVSMSKLNVALSVNLVSNSTARLTMQAMIYTRANATALSSVSSGTITYSWTSSNQTSSNWGGYSGPRMWSIPLNANLTGGPYWLGLWVSTSNAGSYSYLGEAAIALSGIAGSMSHTSQAVPGAFMGMMAGSAGLNVSVAASLLDSFTGGTRRPFIVMTNI